MDGGMEWSNVFILLIMMLYKTKCYILFVFLLTLCSCHLPDNMGFYQPITLKMTIPDGPPEYKAGWHAGCKTAMGAKVFANAFVHQDEKGGTFGSGIYQHDPLFQAAWSHAWFSCITHTNSFVNNHSMKRAPLSY